MRDGVLSLTLLQALTFAGTVSRWRRADQFTVAGSAENLDGRSKEADFTELIDNGFTSLNAGAGALVLKRRAFNALGEMVLIGNGKVTSLAPRDELAGLSFQTLEEKGVDILDSTEGDVTLSIDQAEILFASSLSLAANDTVTLAAGGGTLAGLTFATLAQKGIDYLDATGDNLFF